MQRTADWAADAPKWPPFEQAASLIERFRPRLKDLHLTLDRVLVVGFLGGTGTGKSTLLNALVGQPRLAGRQGEADDLSAGRGLSPRRRHVVPAVRRVQPRGRAQGRPAPPADPRTDDPDRLPRPRHPGPRGAGRPPQPGSPPHGLAPVRRDGAYRDVGEVQDQRRRPRAGPARAGPRRGAGPDPRRPRPGHHGATGKTS